MTMNKGMCHEAIVPQDILVNLIGGVSPLLML